MYSTALKYFAEVVQCRSIRRAAERLHIAPSAISRQIARLEHTLRSPLFERRTNRLVLTEAGSLVAAFAASTAKEFDRLLAAICDISNLMRGSITIATVEAMVTEVLPRHLAAFQTKYPGITATVNVMGTQDVADTVAKGEADIGIAFNPEIRSDLRVSADYPQPLHAIFSPAHPFARRARVSLSELRELRIALPNQSFGIRLLVEKAAKDLGLELHPVLETNNLEMTKSLVRHSSAVTFMPISAVARDLQLRALVAIPMSEPLLSATSIKVLTASARRLPRAAQALLDYLAAAEIDVRHPNGTGDAAPNSSVRRDAGAASRKGKKRRRRGSRPTRTSGGAK